MYYKQYIRGIFQQVRTSDNLIIPVDENNKDYQDFLEWENAGNTAEVETFDM